MSTQTAAAAHIRVLQVTTNESAPLTLAAFSARRQQLPQKWQRVTYSPLRATIAITVHEGTLSACAKFILNFRISIK